MPEYPSPSLYESLGGIEGVRALVDAFYARVEVDPVLRPMFPGSMHCARENLTRFLAESFGGPREHGRRFQRSLVEGHARFRIGPAEAEAWRGLMRAAMAERSIPEPLAGELDRYFDRICRFLVNQPGLRIADSPAEHARPEGTRRGRGNLTQRRQDDKEGKSWVPGPDPRSAPSAKSADVPCPISQSVPSVQSVVEPCPNPQAAIRIPQSEMLDRLWEELFAFEEALAVLERGERAQALALAESPEVRRHTARVRPALALLLGKLGATGEPEALAYVGARLDADPGLIAEPFLYGATLLHHAAGQWATEMVALLLERGAAADARDEFGHPPLYFAGNRKVGRKSRNADQAERVVALLVSAGADVNAASGVKGCTPLHMAARRGNVTLAEALLAHGAAIDPRDRAGETPLRRAVNCSQREMVRFLVERGADVNAPAEDGRSPFQAARSEAARELMRREAKGERRE